MRLSLVFLCRSSFILCRHIFLFHSELIQTLHLSFSLSTLIYYSLPSVTSRFLSFFLFLSSTSFLSFSLPAVLTSFTPHVRFLSPLLPLPFNYFSPCHHFALHSWFSCSSVSLLREGGQALGENMAKRKSECN